MPNPFTDSMPRAFTDDNDKIAWLRSSFPTEHSYLVAADLLNDRVRAYDNWIEYPAYFAALLLTFLSTMQTLNPKSNSMVLNYVETISGALAILIASLAKTIKQMSEVTTAKERAEREFTLDFFKRHSRNEIWVAPEYIATCAGSGAAPHDAPGFFQRHLTQQDARTALAAHINGQANDHTTAIVVPVYR